MHFMISCLGVNMCFTGLFMATCGNLRLKVSRSPSVQPPSSKFPDLRLPAAPALESLTDQVYERTKTIKEIKHVKLLDFDLDSYGTKVLIKEQFMVGR